MVRRAVVAPLALLLAFALAFPLLHRALASPDLPPAAAVPAPPEGSYDVWVVDWGYHTAIIVPQPAAVAVDWQLGPPGRETAAWVEYAWGDRRFYRDSDHRPQAVFAALVLPTESVAYVAARDRPPSSGPRAVYRRTVDAATLRALVMELERTIRRHEHGERLLPTAPVAGHAGRFYAAHGKYLWTRDCNAWTVDRLASVGLARGGLVVLAGQVASRLVGFERVI